MRIILPMLCALLALGLSADAPWFAVGAGIAGIAGSIMMRRNRNSLMPQGSGKPLASSNAHAVRAALFFLVAWLFYNGYSGEESGSPESLLAWAIGRLAAGDWAIRCWQREGFAGENRLFRILLPGLVLMGASNTFDTDFVRWVVPIWFAMVLLGSIEPKGLQPGGFVPRGSMVFRSLAIVLVVVGGLGSHAMVSAYRFEISQVGARLLGERVSGEAVGLSTEPKLGATFGATGSLTRVMRLINWPGDRAYLRAMSFDTYRGGAWLPVPNSRKYYPVNPQWLQSDAAGETVRVQRLINDDNLMFAPVDAAGIRLPDGTAGTFEWARGGPLRSGDDAPDPLTYDIVLPPDSRPRVGPLAQAPTPAEMERLLAVPDEIPLEVHLLAQKIGGAEIDPRKQIQAVEAYLMSHHEYSLTTDPGEGDPIANFVDSDKAAHCEYFASAAVMLLRCLGIPTRYCIGYYVHEKDGDATIVRLRDAHGWAEAYIEGPGGGWVTVEATPGGARPDSTGEPVPFWQKLREHVQDVVAAFRAAALTLSKTPRTALVVACGALVLLAFIAAAWRLVKGRRARRAGISYVAQSRELDAITRRFERWLSMRTRKNKRTAPPEARVQTWREALSAEILEDDARVREWLRLYEAARFGREPGDMARLRQMLQRLEKGNDHRKVKGEHHETIGNHHAN